MCAPCLGCGLVLDDTREAMNPRSIASLVLKAPVGKTGLYTVYFP